MYKLFLGSLLLLSTVSANATNAAEAGKSAFYWRPGFTHVSLIAKSSEVSLSGLNNVASLALDEGPVAGSGVDVSGGGRFSVVLGYKLNEKWSVETIVAPSFDFALNFSGSLRDQSIAPFALGTIPTGIEAFGKTLGSVKALPAVVTLTRQLKQHGNWHPYYGFGLTYVYAFDPSVDNEVLLANGDPSFKVGSDLGLMLQLGSSWILDDSIELNFDLKYGTGLSLEGEIRDITLNSPGLGDVFGVATTESAKVDLSLQALVANISLRWRF